MDTISIYRTIEKKIKITDILKTLKGWSPEESFSTRMRYEEMFKLVRKLIRENMYELLGGSPYQVVTNEYQRIKYFQLLNGEKVSGKKL